MLQIKSYYYENTFIILCMRQQKEKKKYMYACSICKKKV